MLELRPTMVLSNTYELLAQLGQGGMGEVWRAQHLRIPKQVAIKVLASAIQQNAEAMARFRREAEIASRLGHPNIVEILDFNVLADGRSYIVMELLQGEDLRQTLARGGLQLEEVLRLLRQIGSALTLAHQGGVIHRDLKPENIFLSRRPSLPDEPPIAMILDFGISKIQGAQTQITGTHAVIGTPAYMSPEQASGKNDLIDARTDQFSLATITYEMVSGRCPFGGATLTEVIYKVVFENPPSLSALRPSLPEPLIKAIERAMSKQPQARFPDVGSFIRAMEDSLGGAATLPGQGVAGRDLGAAGTLLGPEPLPQGTTGAQAAGAYAGAVASVPQPEATWRGRGTLLIAVLVLVAAGAGVAILAAQDLPEPQARLASPDASSVALAAISAADQGLAVAIADLAAVASQPVDAAAPASDLRQRKPRRSAQPAREEEEEALAPEALERLRLAQNALLAGDYDSAIIKARQSMLAGKNQASWVILAKAYCGKLDLGMARAMLHRVPPARRAAVRRFCAKVDFELPP